MLITKVNDIAECVELVDPKAVLLESVEYLLLDTSEDNLIKFLLDLRDLAIEKEFYLIISAEKEAFTPTGWATLRANMESVE